MNKLPPFLKLICNELRHCTVIALATLLAAGAGAATRTWNNTSTNATNAGSWTGGLPGAADIGEFTAGTATNNPQLRANLSLLGLTFGASTAGWTFTGNSGTRILTIGTSGIFSDSANTQTFSGGNLAIALGGAATFTSNSTGGLNFANTIASFSNGGNLLTLAGTSTSANNLIAEAIAGTGGLTKSGSGTWTLSGANTYSGATTVTAGTLAYGASNVINTGTVTVNGATAILDLGANRTDTVGTVTVAGGGGITGTGTSALTTTGTFEMQSGSVSAILAGAVALNKTTAGTVTLSGANTYTGTTTVSAGTLAYGASNVIASGAVTVNGATAILDLGANRTDTVGTVTVAGGGSITGTGTSALTTTGTFEMQSGSVSAILAGAVPLNKTTTGTVTLSGANTYSGTTTVSAGTLVASGNNSLGDTAGNITVSAGGTLSLGGGTNVTRSGLLTLNGSGASGTTGALHAGGGTGTTSQWTGSTTVNTASTITAADNLLIIGNGAAGQFNTTTLTLNATAIFNTTAAATVVPTYLPVPAYTLDASNIMINSVITGTGGLTKTGTGTLNIIRGSGLVNNTYSGDTTILGGTLIVDGQQNKSAIASTNILVGNSGSANNDAVVFQIGQNASLPAVNNSVGVYNASNDASATNLTVYEDGLFKMNQASNGFLNLNLQGGHINSGGNNALLTIAGTITNTASAQTSLIENGNLGIGSNKMTVNVATGTAPAGVDLQIDSIVQQGAMFTATISGTSLEKTGTGRLVLTGANTYGGVTDILNGVVNIRNATALGQDSTGYAFNDTANGTTVQGTGALELQGGITVNRETLTLGGTGASGTGALRNVSGNNNYNGYVFLSADSRINADTGTTLTIATPSGVNAGLINGTAAGKNLTIGGDGDTIINGAIGGFINNITKDGNGTATFAGNNAYAGTTTVSRGALKITHNNGLAGTGATVSDGAALQFAQNAGSNNITAAGPTTTITGTGLSSGGAIQNLNGNNTFTGGITLAGNALITANTGSSLTMSGNVTGAGFALNASGTGDTTFNGAIGGTGTTLIKDGTGTTTLGGSSANTFTGTTTVNNGTLVLNKTTASALGAANITIGDGVGAAASATLRLAQSNQINDSAAITLNSDGRFDVNGQTETVGSLAGSGKILLAAGQLIGGGNNNSTTFTGTLAGDSSSVFTKAGTGILSIGSNLNASPGDFAGTLNLNAGGLTFNTSNAFTGTINVLAGTTLKLSNATIDVTNLNFTGSGNIILDFSGTASTLNVTNLNIAAGVTINIINWQDATDYFFATNWTGAVLNTTGSAPMNQIIFNSPTWVGNNTKWQSYDKQITPVPEPATYGALLLGTLGTLLGWRRWRQRPVPGSR